LQFGKPAFLAGLLVVVALGWLLWQYRRWQRATLTHWAAPRFLRSLAEVRRGWRVALADVSLWLGLLLLVLALARPQWGSQPHKIARRGLDMAIMLDISASMKKKDLRPNRWQRAVLELQAFAARARGDRMALLAFAGEAGLQAPLTDDATALRELAWHSKPGLFAADGPGLAQAISQAQAVLQRRKQQSYARVIVVLSDGIPGATQAQAIQAARRAGAKGIYLFIVGLLPPGQDGGLQAVASAGGGHYVPLAKAGFGLEAVSLALSQLKRSDRAQRQKKKPIERFPLFLAASALLLLLSRFGLPR